jgi:hypothetical protein
MPHGRRWVAGLLILSAVALAACSAVPEEEEALNEPAKLEAIDGTDVSRITLTAKAAERVDLRSEAAVEAGSNVVIPYAALFYTSSGETWAYTNPEPLTFVRVPVVVDRIRGDRAFLSDGPPAGMEVVTQGATELYGTETDVEE